MLTWQPPGTFSFGTGDLCRTMRRTRWKQWRESTQNIRVLKREILRRPAAPRLNTNVLTRGSSCPPVKISPLKNNRSQSSSLKIWKFWEFQVWSRMITLKIITGSGTELEMTSRNGISGLLNLQNFWGSISPEPPRDWRLRHVSRLPPRT